MANSWHLIAFLPFQNQLAPTNAFANVTVSTAPFANWVCAFAVRSSKVVASGGKSADGEETPFQVFCGYAEILMKQAW
jgi:hypothetical protein